MHPFYTRAATMIGEIAAAVSFISKFLRTKGLTSERQLQTFSQSLQELLAGEWAAEGGRGAPVGCGSRAAANGGSRPGFGGWTAGAPSSSAPPARLANGGVKKTDAQQRN